jgi:hypothetical protein
MIYEKIKPIIDEYLDGKIDISHAADKIVDILFPWYEHYVPLLQHNMDPWQARARDMLLIEDLIAVCGEVADNRELFVMCISQEIEERFFKQ